MQGEARAEQAGTRSSKKDISPYDSLLLHRHRTDTCSPARSYAHARAFAESRPTLLLNLSQNLRILEKEGFLQKKKNQSINTSNPDEK